ncbi:thiol reductant ABC exporter subunit CydC [Mycolicibacter minnesotensis]|uniref:Thiol reductant ABC exporter subunit CydC n=1 Tax=Mycolicibacter minnesotensis TaxID=1118379 RepID=A0A7I7R4M5_9MYCO|nr:thiol reductant ABC exporter subunit CydC [Mycolicibacter minnesotensis]ORA99970.1 thiol reductant ABC exporter subunit CydC [Mycolicibacter minnesotensis]BBY33593.1 thiol reductant ABC exporter subunit CydC [Mycolicibacter minnesotensis]
MHTADPLLSAIGLLRPRLPRLLVAWLLGTLSLCSALALAAVSAWLITRAWQMPPVLDLSIAVVAVRALAISRGVLHYCERLVSHDAALAAAGTARGQLYRRLATGPAEAAARLPSGELVARMGADVDELAGILVRALLPIGVAAVLAVAATAVIAAISPAAATVLAACLLVAGVVAPWLSARAATAQEHTARGHLAERDVAAMSALEYASELRIAGLLPAVIAESQRRQRAWGAALDEAAKPAAIAAALPTAAIAVSVLGAAVAGIGLADAVAPTTVAILMLLPLSAFEATTALPGAAVQLTRSRIAARRLASVAPALSDSTDQSATGRQDCTLTPALHADLQAGHRGEQSVRVRLDLSPGDRVAVTGPSGSGKTTLLMTLAGLLPPLSGRISVAGHTLAALPEADQRRTVSFFAEDAHIFATTVRDNLLVARGDCHDDELAAVLGRVGLGPWLTGLPDGLATVLSGGAQGLSAGQRRRLLLARALLSPARILLLDEPTEHLDSTDSEGLLRAVLAVPGLFGSDRTVVVATHHLPEGGSFRQVRLPHEGSAGPASAAPG